jgi:hypothetical protein
MIKMSFRSCLCAAALLLCAVAAGEFNGTVYQLSDNHVAVTRAVHGDALNLTLPSKADDMALRDQKGEEVGFNSSYLFWRGEYVYSLTFERNVSGNLSYVLPYHGQEFLLLTRESGPVRIILPPGYTTGDRILGIARPTPDEVIEDGSMALSWRNLTADQIIDVSYYRKEAPSSLKRILVILAAAAAALVLEYFLSIRKLRAIREEAEKRA